MNKKKEEFRGNYLFRKGIPSLLLFGIMLMGIVSAGLINFTNPTPANGLTTNLTSFSFNVSLTNASDMQEFKWNWNGTNYTFYDNTLKLMMNLNNVSAIGENETYAVDVSRSGNNGTIYGAVWNSSGKYGGALSFNGVNNYVSASLGPLNAPFSVEAWCYFNLTNQPFGDYDYCLMVGAGANMISFSRNAVDNRFYSWSESQQKLGPVLSGQQWLHIVGVYDTVNPYFKLYIDGEQQAVDNFSAAMNTDGSLSLGRYAPTSAHYLNGALDEIRVWNRSLSADEVKQHYYSNFNKYDADKWQFYTNQSNLTLGAYTYQGFIKDTNNNTNQTEQRILVINNASTNPLTINFTYPTPANGTVQVATSIFVNITSNSSGEHYAILDFNNTLIAWYRLENTSEEFGRNNLSCISCPIATVGKYGNAYDFNGTTYLNGSDINVNLNALSISAWIYPKTVGDAGVVGDWNAGAGSFLIYSISSTQIYFDILNTTGAEKAALGSMTPNQWDHIVGTYDGTDIRIYVNGLLQQTKNHPGGIRNSTNQLWVGRYMNRWFNGTIDEIEVYNRVLSPEEINASYNATKYQYYHNFTNLSAGTYSFKGYAIDNVGNMNMTETRIVTIDSPPNITLNSPQNNTNFNFNNTNVSVILNTILTESDNHSLCVELFGEFNATPSAQALLYKQCGLYNNSQIAYNWTSPVITSQYMNTTGLVGLWHFDNRSEYGENLTQVYDFSGRGNNGSIVGDGDEIDISGGKNAGGLSLNGNGDYVDCGNDSSQNIFNGTLSAWIKTSTPGSSYRALVIRQYQYSMFLKDNEFGSHDWSTGLWRGSGSNLNDGNWHHIAVVFQSGIPGGTSFYVDGSLKGTTNTTIVGGHNNEHIFIGQNAGIQYFNGTIDEVAIWNRSLSADEIRDLYRLKNGTYSWFGNVSYGLNKTQSEIRQFTINISVADITPPAINFTYPTPVNGMQTTNSLISVNISITNASDLNEFKWNWNGTNYTFYDDTLKLMMNFDNVSAIGENGTYAVDVSEYGNNGIINGSPAYNLTGKYGGSYNFDGINDFVNVGNSSSLNVGNNVTFETWVYPTSFTDHAYHTILAKNYSTAFWFGLYSNTGRIQLWVGGVAHQSTGAVLLNKWSHIVATWNGTAINYYINGVLDSSNTETSAAKINNANMYIGADREPSVLPATDPAYYFTGMIDEVAIWNRSLTADEIKQHYYSNFNKYDADKWQFYSNQSNLTIGNYTYQAFVKDNGGNVNQTEQRSLTINSADTTAPSINFTYPTPANSTITTNGTAQINISITEANLDNFIWNWNATNYTFYDDTLKFMMNFDNVSSIGENSTYAVDVSKYGNNGILANGVGWNSSGKYGGAIQFDGIDDYVSIPESSSLNISEAISVGAWVKPSSLSNWATAVMKSSTAAWNDGYGLAHYTSSNDINFFVNNYASYKASGNLTLGNWSYVVGTYNRTSINLYINGQLVDSALYTAAIFRSTSPLAIGKGAGGAFQWNGLIDEIHIYNRSLSADEVRQNYYSNFNKYNLTSWNFYSNQSNLSTGNYTYYGYAKDTSGNANATEQRTLSVISAPYTITPQINFTYPTPATGIYSNSDSIFINLTSNSSGEHYSILDFNRSLVLWMRLNNETGENATYFNDYSSYSNNGTCSGINCPTLTTGKFGNAYYFNGNSARSINVSDNSSLRLSNTGTITAWIKRNNTASTMESIIFKGTSFSSYSTISYILYIDSGLPELYLSNGTAANQVSSAYAWDTNWHYLVGRWNGTNLVIYIDGVQKAVAAQTLNPQQIPTHPVLIGSSNGASYNFNGTIDDIQIYNRALSPEEINASYNATRYQYYHNFTSLTGGIYNYKGYIVDVSGNSNSTETRNITIDSTTPLVSIVYPTNTAYGVNVSALNYTASDTNLQACWYSLNLGVVNTTTTCGTNLTGLTSSEGSNTWTVWANDSFGNVNSSSMTFFKDTIAPIITVYSPLNQTYNTNQILVNFTADSYQALWYYNESANVSHASAHYINLSDGNHTLIFYANDSFNNVNYTSVTFYVNTSLPTISIISPTNTTYNNRTLLVNLSSNGQAIWYYNGTANVTYTTPIYVTFNEGSNILIAYTNNSLGLSNSTYVIFSINTIAPSIIIVSPLNQTYNNRTQLVNISAPGASSIWLYNGTDNTTYTTSLYQTFAEGSNIITGYANDSAGNINSTSVMFTIDTVAPSISIISPANTTYNNQTILINISTSGASNVWFSNGTGNTTYTNELYQTFVEGSNTIIAYANDSVGNSNSTGVTFSINTSAATVLIISPISTTYNTTQILINLTNSSNAQSTWFSNGTGNTTYTIPVYQNFSEGSNTLVAYVNDSFNVVSSHSITFSIDTISPTISIISPTNTTYNNRTILVNISASDINLQSIWFDNGTGNTTYTIPIYRNFNSGSHTIVTYANDSAGNINSTSVTFKISILPLINISFSNKTSLNYTYNLTKDYGNEIYDLNITLYNEDVNNIIIYGFNGSGCSNITFESHTNETFGVEDYAIATCMIFDNMTLHIPVAKGNVLDKCIDWNMTSLKCNNPNGWSVFKSITVGNEYFVTINMTDPGFVEVLPSSPAVSTGGGGGSSGGSCLTNWTCNSWSECNNGIQTRKCIKMNPYCYAGAKPKENLSCNIFPVAPAEEGVKNISKIKGAEKSLPMNETEGKVFNEKNSTIFTLLLLIVIVSYLMIKQYGRQISLHTTHRVDNFMFNIENVEAAFRRKVRRNKERERVAELEEEIKPKAHHPFKSFINRIGRKEKEFVHGIGVEEKHIQTREREIVLAEKRKIEILPLETKSNYVSSLIGRKAYTDDGDYFGEVKEMILRKNIIYGLIVDLSDRIELRDTSGHRISSVLLRKNCVESFGEIIMLRSGVLDKLKEIANVTWGVNKILEVPVKMKVKQKEDEE